MKIVVFGLTITSSWGNGHATTYRSLLRALYRRGHTIVFVEKNVEWYRNNRDLPEPGFCTVKLYDNWIEESPALLSAFSDADAVLVGSYFPDAVAATRELLEHCRCPILFYDIDTPVTLRAIRSTGFTDYLHADLIPHYAVYLSFTGGPVLQELEQTFGARRAIALFCSVDSDLYHPTTQRLDYRCDLGYLGTYAADRQPKLISLLNEPAKMLPEQRFVVAGPQYPSGVSWHKNVRRLMHIQPSDHPHFYSSSRFTLNLTRDAMVSAGYSPSVRLFEASACGAAILSDEWIGLADILEPGSEILLPKSAAEVAVILTGITEEERLRIGQRARDRILAEHTSFHRAVQFEQIISSLPF